LVLRFGRIDSPISFFSFLSYRDKQTGRRPGSRDGSAREDGSRTEAVWGLFIVWYYRCVRAITLYGVEGVGGFQCSFSTLRFGLVDAVQVMEEHTAGLGVEVR
jgi:hypothetical protein